MVVCDPFREQDQEELVKEVIGLANADVDGPRYILFGINAGAMADMVRLHTYIRPLELAYIDAGP